MYVCMYIYMYMYIYIYIYIYIHTHTCIAIMVSVKRTLLWKRRHVGKASFQSTESGARAKGHLFSQTGMEDRQIFFYSAAPSAAPARRRPTQVPAPETISKIVVSTSRDLLV